MISLSRFFPHVLVRKNGKIEKKVSKLIKIETIEINPIINALKYFSKAF